MRQWGKFVLVGGAAGSRIGHRVRGYLSRCMDGVHLACTTHFAAEHEHPHHGAAYDDWISAVLICDHEGAGCRRTWRAKTFLVGSEVSYLMVSAAAVPAKRDGGVASTRKEVPVDALAPEMTGSGLLPDTAGLALAAAARLYANAGIPVFPCLPGRKRPMTLHGFKNATATVGQVDSWWQAYPDANIGIPTGDRFDVLDIDVHPTGIGYPALAALQRIGLTEGWAAAVRSPSGGLHLYYPALSDPPQPSWARGSSHIDFRGSGGYIIAPPSQVVGLNGIVHSYQMIARGRSPWPVNAGAIRHLLAPPLPPRSAGQRSGLERSDGSPSVLSNWVSALAEGNRNAGLFWAACRLTELGMDEHDTLDSLTEPASRIGLDAREIASTIRSAQQTVTAAPVRNDGHTVTMLSASRAELAR